MGTISITQLIVLSLLVILMFGDFSKILNKFKEKLKKKLRGCYAPQFKLIFDFKNWFMVVVNVINKY